MARRRDRRVARRLCQSTFKYDIRIMLEKVFIGRQCNPFPGEAMAKEVQGASEDQRWLVTQNLSRYSGKWIAVAHRTIVASGTSLKEVLEEARAKGNEPFCIQVPEGYITV